MLMNGQLGMKRSINDYIYSKPEAVLAKNQIGAAQLANAISQKDMMVELNPITYTEDQQYQIYKKNFPHMSDQEIKDQLNQGGMEEDATSSLNNTAEKNGPSDSLKQIEQVQNFNRKLTEMMKKNKIDTHFKNQR